MPITLRPQDVRFLPGEPFAFVNDPAGGVVQDLERRMDRVVFESRKLVRVRTGKLFSSIERQPPKLNKTKGPSVDVHAGRRGMRYTMMEHDGTRPHVIRARRKKALRFSVNGQVHFRKQVMHPGTTGTLYLTAALPYAAI